MAKKIKVSTKDLEAQVADLDSKWKRAIADYQNLEKRIQNEKQQFVKLANATLLSQLLPVVDDLERTSEHIDDEGLKLVLKKMHQVLHEVGLEIVEPLEEMFDPETMECVDRVDGNKDMVMKVTEKGYRLGEVLLRPAKVMVGQGTATEDTNSINQANNEKQKEEAL